MTHDYFAVEIGDVPQWSLDTLEPVKGGALEEPWMFVEGKRVADPGPLKMRPLQTGAERTFSVAHSDRTPIADEHVAHVLLELAPHDVQLFPVEIEGASRRHFIVNATKRFDCIDEANCREVQRYPSEGAVPERAGEYRALSGLRIDPTRVEDAQVFRPLGWELALIVSAEVKAALEHIGDTGVFFNPVTGPHRPRSR
ncbi:hypothetical protein LZ198_10210 [Myxococcus sp. K15C18031901]|uniref:imm11 family protein n=1 Tax=Myxococcus dinghuensis TaxID=2906761 RepID=UPI0020A7B1A3|nr:DUF1629 domain-containing protein [Myxococcus dinghuensis]MCP3099243.1 hypothetical protein [Myxococcus dinghuensis]